MGYLDIDIAVERRKLQEILDDLDEQLEDLFQLLKDALDYELDYSPESVRFVELLLANLKPGGNEGNDLLIDAALYIGETFKRHTGGEWEIAEEEADGKYGQPCIRWQQGSKEFYPFLRMSEFAKHYRSDYFYTMFEE